MARRMKKTEGLIGKAAIGGLSLELWNIGPETAEKWLKHGEWEPANSKGLLVRNRNLSGTRVERIAHCIKAGEWQLNGDTIKFDDQGKLRDGQTRLNAIIAARKVVPSVVVRNLTYESVLTYDTNKSRTSTDVVAMAGEGNSGILASAARYQYLYETEQSLEKTKHFSVENANVLATVDKHRGLKKFIPIARPPANALKVPAGCLTFLLYQLDQVDSEICELFVESLRTGANLSLTDPIYVYREFCIKHHMRHKRVMNPYKFFGVTIKAWNAVRAGKKIKTIGFTSAETIPEIM